jgi:hypothetical protein
VHNAVLLRLTIASIIRFKVPAPGCLLPTGESMKRKSPLPFIEREDILRAYCTSKSFTVRRLLDMATRTSTPGDDQSLTSTTTKNASNTVVVSSAQDLQAAISTGKGHIEIASHMDLSGLRKLAAQGQQYLLGELSPTTVSIRVLSHPYTCGYCNWIDSWLYNV